MSNPKTQEQIAAEAEEAAAREAAAKAEAEQKAKAEADAKAERQRLAAELEERKTLTRVVKDGQELFVHSTCVKAHEDAGWKAAQ